MFISLGLDTNSQEQRAQRAAEAQSQESSRRLGQVLYLFTTGQKGEITRQNYLVL